MAALRAGAPIHVPTVERALLLLTDVPGIKVRSTLRPGAAAGTADLQVFVEEDRMPQLSLALDNYGSRYTGQFRTSFGLQLNDMFGAGDQFSFSGVHGFSGLTSGRVGYDFPIGDDGLRMKLSYADLHYHLGGSFDALNIEGDSQIFGGVLQYPLIRSRDTNLMLFAGAESKRLFEKVGAVGSAASKEVNSAHVGLTSSLRDELGGGGVSTASAIFTGGHLQRNSDADAAIDGLTARSAGEFSKFNWQLGRLQRLAPKWSVAAGLSGQFASRNLDSSEKFYLGGPSSVRAYQIGEAAGDEGMLGNLELRYDLEPAMSWWFCRCRPRSHQ